MKVFWSITISSYSLSDGDLETIGELVKQGVTSGEIDGCNGEDE